MNATKLDLKGTRVEEISAADATLEADSQPMDDARADLQEEASNEAAAAS
jgi:hypothetical protein